MQQEVTKFDYLDLMYDEPYIIGKALGFRDFTKIHNDWLKDMIFGKEDETILAHRGSYKTTCLSLAFAIIMILFPNKTIIFTRKTDDDVKEVVKQTTKILKSALFKRMVKKIYGIDLELTEESVFNLTTNLVTATKGASQLLGAGIKTSLTGKHADYVFTDDIVNLKDRVSKAERDLIKTYYQELKNIRNRGGKIFNTGTKWHKEDAIEKLMPNKKIYDCYSTGLISKEELKDLREGMTPSLFAANYELKHIADTEALFTNPQFESDSKLIHNGICHIDASYGGSDGTAFTIVKQMNDDLIVFGKRWNKHVDDCLSEIYKYQEHYFGGSFDVETNGDKGYLAKELRNDGKIVNEYSEHTNKFIKISTFLRKYWNNIKFLEETDPDYLNEILDYTENAEHDDSPDSLASAIRKLTGKRKWLT